MEKYRCKGCYKKDCYSCVPCSCGNYNCGVAWLAQNGNRYYYKTIGDNFEDVCGDCHQKYCICEYEDDEDEDEDEDDSN